MSDYGGFHICAQLNSICNRNVFSNFLPCSHAINPNNETCQVTCTTWLTYVRSVFPLI